MAANGPREASVTNENQELVFNEGELNRAELNQAELDDADFGEEPVENQLLDLEQQRLADDLQSSVEGHHDSAHSQEDPVDPSSSVPSISFHDFVCFDEDKEDEKDEIVDEEGEEIEMVKSPGVAYLPGFAVPFPAAAAAPAPAPAPLLPPRPVPVPDADLERKFHFEARRVNQVNSYNRVMEIIRADAGLVASFNRLTKDQARGIAKGLTARHGYPSSNRVEVAALLDAAAGNAFAPRPRRR